MLSRNDRSGRRASRHATGPTGRAIRHAALEVLESRRMFSAGDLDFSWGASGTATVTPGGVFEVVSIDTRGGRTVILGDTGVTAPGGTGGGSNVVALNSSGNIDNSFSSDGRRPIPRLTDPRDIFIQPDGKILVAGKVDGKAGVARLLANGGADTSFSGDGFVSLPLMTEATGVRVASNGKIVLSGNSPGAGSGFSNRRFAAARLNANGTPDNTFSGDGVAVTTFAGTANAVAVQSDGKVILVGATPDFDDILDIGVVRLTAGGAFDNSFSGDGRFTYNFSTGDTGTAVDIAPNGKILVGGTFGPDVGGALRLNTNGTLDIQVTNAIDTGERAVVNNIRSSFDGSRFYLFADRYRNGSLQGSTIAAFDSDGTRDHTFANAGQLPSLGEGHGDLQADGKLITAGNAFTGGDPDEANYSRIWSRRHTNVIDPNDRIQLLENIVVEGTTGNDTITVNHNLQTGIITVNLNGTARQFGDTAISNVRIEGGLGADTINTTNLFVSAIVYGGDGNDTINTGSRGDDVDGGAGNDTINTGGGDDLARGGTGDDRISGGDGTDRLNGNLGRDMLFGNAGNDYLAGNVPGFTDGVPDHLDGGLGTDTAIFRENHDTVASIEQFD